MAGVGRQIFRRATLHGCCQNEIKTDGTAQLVWSIVGQNAVVQARREQHKQTRAWGQIPVGLIERVAFSNRAAITHRQTRHQLIVDGMNATATRPPVPSQYPSGKEQHRDGHWGDGGDQPLDPNH